MDIGRTIKTARQTSGSTLRALAERAGTSHSALAAYESNAKIPRADTMHRVLEAAGWRVVVMPTDELSWDERVARGEELEAVLDLAAHFPRRDHPTLRATVRHGGVMELDLPRRIVDIHDALDAASLPHAFGGALALAWCTLQARATIDVDVNVFVPTDRAADALAALPAGVTYSDADLDLLARDGQVRVWWDGTPIDVFLNTTEYHAQVAGRARLEPFRGEMIPFLACNDLAVFKAFFNRTKDWADLEAMIEAGRLDATAVLGALTLYLGGDDERIARLRGLVT